MQTFHELLNGFLKFQEPKSSWVVYRRLCTQHFDGWPAHPTYAEIEDWHRNLIAVPHLANKGLAFLKAMYTWGMRRGQYPGPNPATGVKQHRTFSRDRVMTEPEIAILFGCLDMLPQKMGALALLLLTTGCRLSEALAMREEDLNMQTGEWVQLKTKNGRAHMTYVPEQARAALRLLVKKHGWFFAGAYEHHWSRAGAEKVWWEVRGSLGLSDVRLHDFRRTLATHLYRATKDEYLVKRCINHVNRNVTAIYVRISHEEVASALQAQADRFMALTPTNGGLQGHLMTRHVSRPTHYERSLT